MRSSTIASAGFLSVSLALWGCGRLRYTVHLDTDAGAPENDARAIDAANDAFACVLGAWGPAELVNELSSPEVDYLAEVRGDGLVAYITSNRASGPSGTFGLYVSRRSSRTEPFGPVEPLVVEEGVYVGDSATTSDHLEIVVSYDGCLHVATRAAATEPFDGLRVVPALCSNPLRSSGPAFTADALTLYFTRRSEAPMSALSVWRATRPTRSEPFGAPVLVPALDETTNAGFPALSADQRTLFLEQRVGSTELDIAVAHRPDVLSDWGAPVRFDPASAPGAHDGDPSITDDGLELYFSSDRPGGLGGDDVWVIRRRCE